MTHWILLWFIAFALFVAIDMVWLLWLGRSFYVTEIGGLLRDTPGLVAAVVFYVLYVTGLLIMVVWPAHQASSVSQALLFGAVLGLVAYGTYDFTNLSVMKGFTAKIAMIDLAWGTILTGAVSAITVWVGTFLRSA